MAKWGGANFGVDNSEGSYFAGYLNGVASRIETPEHIGAAVDFAANHLSNRFSDAMDLYAAQNKERFHHVYEWGEDYGDKSTVGSPQFRLWKLIVSGKGTDRGVAFTFLPSVRTVPLHPEEEKYNVSPRHTFTWKAPVMEFGMTVRIAPVEAARGKMVFFDERVGKIVIRKKPVTTVPGYRTGVQGSFTGFFVRWWGADAQAVFDNEVRPILERNTAPRDASGRFAKGRKKWQKIGSKYNVTFSNVDFAQGQREAEAAMQRIAAGYKQGAGGWENYRGQ